MRLKIASPFLASAARIPHSIDSLRAYVASRKKSQTALQGEKNKIYNKSGQSYVYAEPRSATRAVVIDCIFMPLIELPFLAHHSLWSSNVFNKSLIITPPATRVVCVIVGNCAFSEKTTAPEREITFCAQNK